MLFAPVPQLMLTAASLVPPSCLPSAPVRVGPPVMVSAGDRDKLLPVHRLPEELLQQRHQYFDRVKIVVQGGSGGNGAVISLPRDGSGPRLEKTDGGDVVLPPGGGKGGDVILFVDPAVPDLLHLHRRPQLTAERGRDSPGLKHLEAPVRMRFGPSIRCDRAPVGLLLLGAFVPQAARVRPGKGYSLRSAQANRRLQQAALRAEAGEEGATQGNAFWDGANLRIPIPAGSFVRTAGGRVLGDLVSPGQELIVASGGRGGPCVLSSESSRGKANAGRSRRGGRGRGGGGRPSRRSGFETNEMDEIQLSDSELFEVTRREAVCSFRNRSSPLPSGQVGRDVRDARAARPCPTIRMAAFPLADVRQTGGQPAEKPVTLQLLLRTVADVGFIGFPNAGKSTLLRGLTRAKAEVAPYPFTTLMPNLGAMQTPNKLAGMARSTPETTTGATPGQAVIADLPGLVEGAHKGRGLGRQFLQQLRRVRLVLYVLDTTDEESPPAEQYSILLRELELYNPDYLDRPHIIALNKLDIVLERDGAQGLEAVSKRHRNELLSTARATSAAHLPLAVLPISGLKGKGITALQDAIVRTLATCR